MWREIRETNKHGETQSYNFRAYYSFGSSYSCTTVVKWDAYDLENTTGKARRCKIHSKFSSRFHPGNRAEVLYDKISSSHTEIPVGKPRSRELRQPALSYEPIENFTKDLEVRRDLGNRASLVNWAHVKRP